MSLTQKLPLVRIVTSDKTDLFSRSEGGRIAWGMASTCSWQTKSDLSLLSCAISAASWLSPLIQVTVLLFQFNQSVLTTLPCPLILIYTMFAAFWISCNLMIHTTKLMDLHALYHLQVSSEFEYWPSFFKK